MHPIAKLARDTIEGYIREGRIPEAKEFTPEMIGQAGVFVSIRKYGELRGCIGTFEPTRRNIADEVITNAINSAARDPRFPRVTVSELWELEYSVDVLARPEFIRSRGELDPRRYGLIVECGGRKGLLLPDLDGVNTAEEQVAICCQKAGIMPDEPMKLYRFEVRRYR